jgi:hypothetical protein
MLGGGARQSAVKGPRGRRRCAEPVELYFDSAQQNGKREGGKKVRGVTGVRKCSLREVLSLLASSSPGLALVCVHANDHHPVAH